MNKCELKLDNNDVVLIVNKKEVFRKNKSENTKYVARLLYMAYKYEHREEVKNDN